MDKKEITKYYDSVASKYHSNYNKSNSEKYNQNYIRLQILIRRLLSLKIKSVYEIGVGDGTPLSIIDDLGIEVYGNDLSSNMVIEANKKLQGKSIIEADIEDIITVTNACKVDAVVAFGVMPHIDNDKVALNNMGCLLKESGRVFIEFRNKLFSLFTFNQHTKDFILNDLLTEVDSDLKKLVAHEIDKRILVHKRSDSYDNIKAKYHNPLTIKNLFSSCGYELEQIYFYHYHAGLPVVGEKNKELFYRESKKLENEYDWKGMFLCSAFIVEASLC